MLPPAANTEAATAINAETKETAQPVFVAQERLAARLLEGWLYAFRGRGCRWLGDLQGVTPVLPGKVAHAARAGRLAIRHDQVPVGYI